MTPLGAILFDFDGTLTDYVSSDLAALTALYHQVKSSASLDCFLDTAVEEIMSFHGRVERAEADPLQMHTERLRHTFRRHAMPWHPHYVNVYRDQLLQSCTPLAGAHTLLRRLYPHFKLGLLTNAYDGREQRARLRQSGLEHYFQKILVAGEVGLFKPDTRVFHLLLTLMDVKPDEAVYVGDSPAHDIDGAVDAGMKAVLIRPGRPHPRASLTLPSLEALATLWTDEDLPTQPSFSP